MSTKKQQFYGESKLYFYLRDPKRTGPRLVYLSTYIDGKHYVLSTKVKVYAYQWNFKKQLAVISNVQSKQDNRNNKIVNDQLSKVRRYYSEFIEYICNNDVDDIGETLKLFIYRNMAKKKKIDLKRIIAEALEHYHTYVKKTIKDSTKRQNESLLSEFGRFVDTLPEKDKTMRIFSQKGLNRYKQYLIDKMDRSKTDGKKRNFGVGQLNRCGGIIALLINRVLVEKEDGISTVVWNKVDDPRSENQKGHVPLLDDEVTAIENCSGLTDVEKEYRNIFLLQIECGQRVSDLAKILTGDYVVGQVDGCECILITTKKENTPAVVDLTPKVRILLERIKSHKLVDPQEFKNKTEGKGNNTYNEAIRRIAKKAGLDRVIVKIDSNQIEEKRPLYEVITNHDARSTFITNKIKEGVPPDKLCIMTGHASEEMINRVYAQLTIEDKIRSITPYLSHGKNEKDADSPTDSTSKNPNEIESFVPKEVTTTMPINLDSEPSSIFESDEIIAYDNYIRGLNDLVDEAIKKIEAFQLFGEEDTEVEARCEDLCQRMLNVSVEQIEEVESQLQSQILESNQLESNQLESNQLSQLQSIICEHIPTEVIFGIWQYCDRIIEPGLREVANDFHNNPRDFVDRYRLSFIRSMINYLIENNFGKDAIESLEEKFHAMCKENQNAFLIYREAPYREVVLPIRNFIYVVVKMEQFIQENRPIVDDTMIREDNRALKKVDWRVVFRELQKTPAMALETLIQNTKCGGDVKSVLSNSVKEGDFESFNKTIITHEHEVRILINHSYSNQYFRMFAQTVDNLFKESTKRMENPIDMINRYNEALLLLRPYVDNINDESTSKDVQEIDNKERSLWLLDNILKAFDDDSKKYLYPSEKRIFDKVLSIVDFNKHPELKVAYEDYKARQNVASGSERPIEQVDIPEDKKKKDKVQKKEKQIVSNYITFSTKSIDIDKLVTLLTDKDEGFVTLVQCDSANVDVTTCLKHFLGLTSPTPISFILKWNGKGKVSLKFLIRLLLNKNNKATEKNVIDETKSDGISKIYVSTGQGQGRIWPSVCKVFNYDNADSIMTARLGDSDKAISENLEQLKAIAKIYFACRK